MTELHLSDELIKDFIYSVYRKEVLINLQGVVLTDEDKDKLHEKRDFVNALSEQDLDEFRTWVMDKLQRLEETQIKR
ncbi:hypothetical protein PT273_06920 [Orbaceae bacterium ESL0727]|nr:hypothetical protein [Orbaceae bacterium ESL0727]